MRKSVKAIVITAAVLLLVGMTIMIILYQISEQKKTERITALTAEAKPYETEMTQLKREQELQERQIRLPEGPGAAVIAFRLDGENALETALEYGERLGFEPSILVNIDDEASAMADILSESGLDIILTGSGFTESTPDRLRTLKKSLEDTNCRDTRAFLLRAADDTKENRQILHEAGIEILFLYGDSLSSAMTESGTAEINYSYVNKSGYDPASRLWELADSEQGLLFAVDLKETGLTEAQIGEILAQIKKAEKAGGIRIGSVEDAVETVQNRMLQEQARQEAFLQLQAIRQERIDELEDIIRDIYSHWED